jgi:hypothetical protein
VLCRWWYLLAVLARCIRMLLGCLGQARERAQLPAPVEGGCGILKCVNIGKSTCTHVQSRHQRYLSVISRHLGQLRVLHDKQKVHTA